MAGPTATTSAGCAVPLGRSPGTQRAAWCEGRMVFEEPVFDYDLEDSGGGYPDLEVGPLSTHHTGGAFVCNAFFAIIFILLTLRRITICSYPAARGWNGQGALPV